MQISDLYRQTKRGRTLRPKPDRERSQPTKWVASKIPEIAKVGSPREWFFRIAVLY